jgi:hypothetical protein
LSLRPVRDRRACLFTSTPLLSGKTHVGTIRPSEELADAELANTQTQLAQIQALHDTVIARARLARATGAELP